MIKEIKKCKFFGKRFKKISECTCGCGNKDWEAVFEYNKNLFGCLIEKNGLDIYVTVKLLVSETTEVIILEKEDYLDCNITELILETEREVIKIFKCLANFLGYEVIDKQ